MRDEPVETGEIIAGKYRVERIIGQGMMGQVVAATHLKLGHQVALKIMLGGAGSREQAARFSREAKAVAKLRSEHAGRVFDVDVLDSGAPYIVMELHEGKDLAAHLEARGPLAMDEALTYVLQVCEAVGEAHAAGIVHRDLKPANLFLTAGVDHKPLVKVLDFGVSKLIDDARLTRTGEMLGSPLYMSPEQMNASHDVDGRSDVWALGVILYQLLTDTTPFTATTVMELCAKIFRDAPVPLGQHRPDLPAGLVTVVMQCLEKDRARRWPSVVTFAAALAPWAPAHAAVYVQRIAGVQKSDVAAAKPTVKLAVVNRGPDMDSSSAVALPVSSPEARTAAASMPIDRTAGGPARARRILAVALPVVLGGAIGMLVGLRALGSKGAVASASAEPSASAAPAVTPSATEVAPGPAVEARPSTTVAPGGSTSAPAEARPAGSVRLSATSSRTDARPAANPSRPPRSIF